MLTSTSPIVLCTCGASPCFRGFAADDPQVSRLPDTGPTLTTIQALLATMLVVSDATQEDAMRAAESASALARAWVRASGARVTDARVRVLALLIDATNALSHQDVLDALAQQHANIDRVTVYRVLDWLTEQSLAHRISAEDRVYRFSAQDPQVLQAHGHFHCSRCHKVFCLDSTQDLNRAVQSNLPSGFHGDRVELTVYGHCGACQSATA